MIQRTAFAAAAQQLVGTPFRHRGRVPGGALDCVGVVVAAAAACGLVLQEPPPYGTMPPSIVGGMAAAFVEIPAAERGVGDVIAILWLGEPRHLAVIVGGDARREVIVHAKANIGRVAEHRIPRGWRVHSAWRLRGAA